MSLSIRKPSLAHLLRSTLLRLEEAPDHDPADTHFLDLKRSILLSIAELERQREDAA